mgnify:CR=1 FL=1
MKNIKDITISIFAIIGFVAIVTGFTNEAEQPQTTTTLESQVWEFYVTGQRANYLVNRVTGEVRLFKGAEADRHYWGIDKDKNIKD